MSSHSTPPSRKRRSEEWRSSTPGQDPPSPPGPKYYKREGETDQRVLARRQKQIDYGKVTDGYKKYVGVIPKHKRTRRQPWTPNKYQICSRRSWDGQIKIWRLLLHAYDGWDFDTSKDWSDQSLSLEDSVWSSRNATQNAHDRSTISNNSVTVENGTNTTRLNDESASSEYTSANTSSVYASASGNTSPSSDCRWRLKILGDIMN